MPASALARAGLPEKYPGTPRFASIGARTPASGAQRHACRSTRSERPAHASLDSLAPGRPFRGSAIEAPGSAAGNRGSATIAPRIRDRRRDCSSSTEIAAAEHGRVFPAANYRDTRSTDRTAQDARATKDRRCRVPRASRIRLRSGSPGRSRRVRIVFPASSIQHRASGPIRNPKSAIRNRVRLI
jgi:hypothetical protein